MNSESPSPLEQYQRLIGTYVTVTHGQGYFAGKLSSIDSENGLFVLEDSPVVSYANQTVIRRDISLVPFLGKVITQTTKEELDAIAESMGHEFQHLNSWVKVGDNDFGKLQSISTSHYTLSPALVFIADCYRWQHKRPVHVPKNGSQRIIPVFKKDLEALAKESRMDTDIRRFQKQEALADVKRAIKKALAKSDEQKNDA